MSTQVTTPQLAPSGVPYVPMPQNSVVSISPAGPAATNGVPAAAQNGTGTSPLMVSGTSSGPLQVTANAAAGTSWSGAIGLLAILGVVVA